MKDRKAIIAGASGLTGKHLLSLLENSDTYGTVYVLTRRPLKLFHPKVRELTTDFDDLDKIALPPVDDVFCCLGTTMKKAGSKEAFRKVDFEYPLQLAKKAAYAGASQYLLISALGAKSDSFFFYNRIKGELEEEVSKISQYKKVAIFRPSLLLGEREKERSGEGVAKVLMKLFKPLLRGPFRKYRPVYARTVANGMLRVAGNTEDRGIRIYESEEIKPLAAEMIVS